MVTLTVTTRWGMCYVIPLSTWYRAETLLATFRQTLGADMTRATIVDN